MSICTASCGTHGTAVLTTNTAIEHAVNTSNFSTDDTTHTTIESTDCQSIISAYFQSDTTVWTTKYVTIQLPNGKSNSAFLAAYRKSI
jgi:hypothetical protein